MKWKPRISKTNKVIKYTGDKSLVFASNLEPYVGLYYENNGRFWTYTENGTGESVQLINEIKNRMILNYSKATKPPFVNVPSPVETSSVPNEKDYKKGYYQRYFVKKVNEINSPIIEVSKQMTESLKAHPDTQNLYKICEIRWKLKGPKYDMIKGDNGVNIQAPAFLDHFSKISGIGQMPSIIYGVHSTNKRTVKMTEKSCMKGLTNKISRNYSQFAEIENANPFSSGDSDNSNVNDGLPPPPPPPRPPIDDGGPNYGPNPVDPNPDPVIPLTNMLLDLDPAQDVFNTSTASAANEERIYKI